MENHLKDLARKVMKKSAETLTDSEKITLNRWHKREQVSKDVHAELEAKDSFGDRLSDAMARIGGSWGFIIGFVCFLIIWAVINTIVLLTNAFDPYPFIFLNLVLSMLAAAQAPIIMMAQNRQAEKDRAMAEHDYQVNLKAELEIMSLHEKFDQMRADQLAAMIAAQQEQIRLLTQLVQEKGART
ncbi:MAG TPA: DUF1003 domain-containing protein [Micropepsaceae bacterium]|nr:DUF1003 domain-containing protein [Micropepsaceae bacterium]HRK71935.1 DUF1003 domain-containing protein [Micropepsaceae bacterium]